MAVLAAAIARVTERITAEGLVDMAVSIRARVLSTEEAIGNPTEYDFPLLKGREKSVEARLGEYRGHAFTDMYGGFQGTVGDVLALPLKHNYNRALIVATINALCDRWGSTPRPVHCRDEVPRRCAGILVDTLAGEFPTLEKLTFIGYQPAMIDVLSKQYRMTVLDLDQANIGTEKFGVTILDGNRELAAAAADAELVMTTGSTLVNGTIDDILAAAGATPVIFYGVTIAGTAALLGLRHICYREAAGSTDAGTGGD